MIPSGLRLWLDLPWLQRRVLLRAALWLALVDVGLRVLGFRRMIDLVPAPVAGAGVHGSGHVPMYVAALEIVASGFVVPAHCLHKSLVLQFWLRREGIPSQLRIGVRKEDQQLKAHAWVELDDAVLNDDAQAVGAFRPLAAPQVENVMWTRSATDLSRPPAGVRKAEA
jgi:hypothetical protein